MSTFMNPHCAHQAPEKFLAALAVLGAAWQFWSNFNKKNYGVFLEPEASSQKCVLGIFSNLRSLGATLVGIFLARSQI